MASALAIYAIATWVMGIQPQAGKEPAQSSDLDVLGTVAHIDAYPELLIRSVWTGIGEEVAAVLLVTGLTRRNVPVVWVYAIPAIVRATYHAQFSLAALELIILGVGLVYLWRRYQRLLPLIAAHTLWDALGRDYPMPLMVLVGAGLLIVIGWCAWSGKRRLRRRTRPAEPLTSPAIRWSQTRPNPPNPAEPGTPVPTTGAVTSWR